SVARVALLLSAEEPAEQVAQQVAAAGTRTRATAKQAADESAEHVAESAAGLLCFLLRGLVLAAEELVREPRERDGGDDGKDLADEVAAAARLRTRRLDDVVLLVAEDVRDDALTVFNVDVVEAVVLAL